MTSKHSGWRGRRWRWSVQQTTRQRVPQCTIAGDRAEQSPTKGAVCRPSRHRVSDETTELWRQRPLHTQPCEGEESEWFRVTPDHAQQTRRSARGRANSSSRQRKPLTNQGTTAKDGVYGARGARLTHSQTATPESEYASRLGKHVQMDDPDEKKPKERTYSW